jgi:hypothetical protein
MYFFKVKPGGAYSNCCVLVTNHFVKRAEGGPATGSMPKGYGCVELGRCCCRQILNCMITITISAEMLKLTNV